MSREIDEKVVEMRFDNRDFEKNVNTSLSTLDKLKEKLKFHGAEKGFEDLSSAAGRVNFGGMGDALDTVKVKFNALEAVAINVLSNLATSAINTGVQFVKSLSVDNIAAGWQKFGDKTTSVATLVSQGYDLELVNEQLDRLNWFTDETSYNFVDMVREIGKFTASGQGLEESVTAMEGIANWAALSGQNAAVASRAMYQLSQAMGKGALKYDDWKSIQNASMDTIEFRRVAAETAVELGTLGRNAAGDFTFNGVAETLNELFTSDLLTKGQWLTSDVMMATFTKYASAVDQVYDYAEEKGITASEAIAALGDQVDEFGLKAFRAAQEARTWVDTVESIKDAVSTGWMNTFELVFGDYAEAKTLWTDLANELYDVFAEGGNVRNEVLEEWKETLNGRDDLFLRIREQRTDFEEAIKNNSGIEGLPTDVLEMQLNLTPQQGALWNLYDALFAFDEEADRAIGIVAIVKQAFSDVFGSFNAEGFKNFTQGLREFTASLVPSAEKAEKLRSTFKGLFAILDIGKQVISAVWRTISPIFQKFGVFSDILLDNTADLGERIAAFAEDLRKNDTIFKTIQNGLGVIQNLLGKVRTFVDPAIQKLREWWQAALDYFKIPEDATIVTGIITVYHSLRDIIESELIPLLEEWWNAAKDYLHLPNQEQMQAWWQSFKTNVGTTLSGAVDTLKEWGRAFWDYMSNINWEGVKNSFKGLGASIRDHFGGAIDICRQGLERLREMLPDLKNKFSQFGSSVGQVFSNIWGFIKTNILGENNEGLVNLAKGLIGISAADLLHSFAGPLKELKSGFKNMFKGLSEALDDFGDILGNYKKQGFIDTLTKLAFAFAALGISLAILSKNDPNAILSSGGALAGMLVIMTGALKLLDNSLFDWETVAVILAMSIAFGKIAKAIQSLVSVAEEMKEIRWQDVVKAIVFIASTALSIGAAIKMIPSDASIVKIGIGMMAIAVALKILSGTIKEFQNVSWETIAKGGTVVVGAIMAIALALRIVSGGAFKESFKGSIFSDKGKADIEKMKLNAIAIGFAFIEIAAALEIVSHVIKTLGEMDWNVLLQGGLAMTAAIGVIVAAIRLLPNGGEVAAAGLGLLEISVALGILGGVIKSLGKLATSSGGGWILTGGLLAVVGAFGALALGLKMLQPLSGTIITLAGGFALAGVAMLAFGVGVQAVAAGLIALGAAFAAGGVLSGSGLAAMAAGIGVATKAALQAIVDMIPVIFDGIKSAFFSFLEFLQESAGKIVETVGVILVKVLEGVEIYGPQIAEVLFNLITAALDWLNENGAPLLDKIFDFLVMLIDKLTERLPELIDHVVQFLAALFSGVVTSLEALDPDILLKTLEGMGIVAALMAACAGLSTIFVPAMKGLGEVSLFIVALGGVLAAIGGLASIPGAMDLVGKGGDMLGEIGAGIGKFFGGIAGGAIGQFCKEIEGVTPDVLSAADSLASIILKLTAGSVVAGLSVFLGGPIGMAAFGLELKALAPCLKQFAQDMAGVDVDVIKNSAPILEQMMKIGNNAPRYGGLWQAFTGQNSLAIFGAELAAFGPFLKEYGKSLVGLSITAINDSMEIVERLIEVGKNAPRYGGLWQAFTGQNSIGILGSELATFGPHLKEYGKSLVGLSITAINNSMEIVEKLIEIGKNAPRYGGLWQAFTGQNSIGILGAELATFGPHLKEYGKSIVGLSITAISDSMEIVESLIEVGKNAPRYGGIWQAFIGENSLAAFGAQLAAFGPYIKTYGESVGNLPTQKIQDSLPAITSLVDLANTISEKMTGSGLISGAVAAIQNLLGADGSFPFGNVVSKLGTAMTDFYNNLGEINYGTLDQAISRLPKLVKALGDIDEFDLDENSFPDGIIEALGAAVYAFYSDVKTIKFDDLDKAIKYMRELAKVLDDISSKDYATEGFTSALKKVGQSMVTAVISGVEDKAANLYKKIQEVIDEAAKRAESSKKDFTAIGESFCEKIGTGFNNRKSKLSSDVSLALTGMLSALKLKNTEFQNAGQSMIDYLIKGFQSKSAKLADEFESVVATALSRLKDYRDDFEQTGKYLAEGITKGIESTKSQAVASGGEMIDDIVTDMKRRSREHSPSRVTMEIGAYMAEGLAIGLRDNSRQAALAGGEVAQASLKSISDVINAMSTDMTSEEMQPVITPVLDLSRIQAQRQLVDAMFGGNRLVGSVAASAAMQVNARNQNADSSMVAELRTLRGNMENMLGRMAQMKVVMDSGELVGALSAPMDSALGTAAVRYRRGN